MKFLKTLSLIAVLGFGSAALAQDSETKTGGDNTFEAKDVPPNVISINPLGLIFGYIAVDYERALSPAMSVVIDGRVGLLGLAVGVNSFGLGGGVHFFFESLNLPFGTFTGKAPSGPWWGPEASVDFVSTSFGGWMHLQGGALVGYNYAFGDNNQWVISVGAGLGAYFTTGGITTVPGATVGGLGITGMGRGSLGYAF